MNLLIRFLLIYSTCCEGHTKIQKFVFLFKNLYLLFMLPHVHTDAGLKERIQLCLCVDMV